MPSGVYIRTEKHLAQIRSIQGANKGRRFNKEWRENLSKSHKGQQPWMIGRKHTEETKQKMVLSAIGKHIGEKNSSWKGGNVGYFALHAWIKRSLGKPDKCTNGCIAKRYVWANISGEYKRDFSDWYELCDRCNLSDGIKIAERFLEGGYQNSSF